jgi:hypothetical protein
MASGIYLKLNLMLTTITIIPAILVLFFLTLNITNNNDVSLESHSSIIQSSKQADIKLDFTNDIFYMFSLISSTVNPTLTHIVQAQEGQEQQEIFVFNYTYLHELSGIHYIISYDSNTNELTVTSRGEEALDNKLLVTTPYIAAKNLKFIFDKNGFFTSHGNGPPFIPDSSIETLSASSMNGSTIHTVTWGYSQEKEIPANLLILTDLVREALCLSYADDIIILSTKKSILDYVLC